MTCFYIENGILHPATFVASPNFNQRPTSNTPVITGIVIHNISLPPSQFGKTNQNGVHFVKAFFQNQLNAQDHPYFATINTLQVSAHLFIERDGTVTQFVNFDDRAWHAGVSAYLGRKNCNDFTIGIELEGDDYHPFENCQYQTLADIIIAIYHAYPATERHLMGHSDIAPIRKTDPGPYFDWQKLRHLIDDRLKGKTHSNHNSNTKSAH